MDHQRLYYRKRQTAASRIFVEVTVVEHGSDEMLVLIPQKKLAKCTHIELFHECGDGEFVSETFRVAMRKKSRDGTLLRIGRVSAKKSANMRESVRVATEGIHARFAGDHGCRLLDVSDKGFCVISAEIEEIGSTVYVEIEHRGDVYGGEARVVSAREYEPGLTRYGMCCDSVMGAPADDLGRFLPRLSLEIQLMVHREVTEAQPNRD